MKSAWAFIQDVFSNAPNVVSADFETHSVEETRRLGAAFANVARLDSRPEDFTHKIMRIGLRAFPGTGKTTFASGLIDGFGAPLKNEVTGKRQQIRGESNDAGLIRSVDALLSKEDILPSYIGGWMEMRGEQGVDLIEHPQCERSHARTVDYLVVLHAEPESYNRKIEIICFEDKARSKGFQEFLRAANGNVASVMKKQSAYSGGVLSLLR